MYIDVSLCSYTQNYSIFSQVAIYDWLCHLATFFVPIITDVAKWQSQSHSYLCCVIQWVKYFDKVISWPQLISNHLVTPASVQSVVALTDWPRTFYIPGVFVWHWLIKLYKVSYMLYIGCHTAYIATRSYSAYCYSFGTAFHPSSACRSSCPAS